MNSVIDVIESLIVQRQLRPALQSCLDALGGAHDRILPDPDRASVGSLLIQLLFELGRASDAPTLTVKYFGPDEGAWHFAVAFTLYAP
jgi:hypothetical protein